MSVPEKPSFDLVYKFVSDVKHNAYYLFRVSFCCPDLIMEFDRERLTIVGFMSELSNLSSIQPFLVRLNYKHIRACPYCDMAITCYFHDRAGKMIVKHF